MPFVNCSQSKIWKRCDNPCQKLYQTEKARPNKQVSPTRIEVKQIENFPISYNILIQVEKIESHFEIYLMYHFEIYLKYI